MKTKFKKYNEKHDFIRIRDFLSENFKYFGNTISWRIERWNYSRYFVAPMLSDYGISENDADNAKKAIQQWESTIGVWEKENHEIVGAVFTEHMPEWHPEAGNVFFQYIPEYSFLLPEMLDYTEENFINPPNNAHIIHIYKDDEVLTELVKRRGYHKIDESGDADSVLEITGLPSLNLPDDYRVQSMADENNIELRRKVFGLGFNHPEPKDWPSAFSYRELQKAPDYRKDLDLYIVAPNGEYASFCIVWYDEANQIGILEPVGTHPDYRRKGLAKEVVWEGIRRVAKLGAKKIWVGSDQKFYLAIGFEKRSTNYKWIKKLES